MWLIEYPAPTFVVVTLDTQVGFLALVGLGNLGGFCCIYRCFVVNREPALMDSTPKFVVVTLEAQIGFLALVSFVILVGFVESVDVLWLIEYLL